MSEAAGGLSVLLCDRRPPAVAGTRAVAAIVLEELGHRVTAAQDGHVELSAFDAILLWGNPGYFPRIRRQLRCTPRDARPIVAVMHTEPLPPPRASGLPRWSPLSASEIVKILLCDWRATDIYSNAFKLRRMMRDGTIDLLFTGSAEKLEYAQEQGYPCWHIPYGYHRSHGTLLGLERDVDVLFLGDTRPRRRRRLLAYLRAQGIDVTVRGSWYDPSGFGESRVRLLNRTKIVVHLQRYPGKLAAMRLVLAMANGALVISEPAYRGVPFVVGTHYVAAPVYEMPAAIRYYLDHSVERERITAAAHAFITRELTFAQSMTRGMDLIQERLGSRRTDRGLPNTA